MSRLKQLLAQQSEKLSVAEQVAADAKEERDRALNDAMDRASSLARVNAELEERTARLQALEDRSVESAEKTTSHYQRAIDAERKCARIEADLERAVHDANAAAVEHAESTRQLHADHIANVERLKEELQIELRRHGEEVAALSAQIATLEEENKSALKRVDEEHARNTELGQRIQSLEKTREQVVETNGRLTMSLEVLRKSAEENQKEILENAVKLRERIAADKAEMAAKTKLISDAKTRAIAEKRQHAAESKGMIRAFQRRLRTLKEHILSVISNVRAETEAAKSDMFRQVREVQWKIRESVSKSRALALAHWEAEKSAIESNFAESSTSKVDAHREALETQAAHLRESAEMHAAVLNERIEAAHAACE